MSNISNQTSVLSDKRLRELVVSLLPDWHTEALKDFSHLPGGYNNRNYQFSFRDESYVLRVPGGAQANFPMEKLWLTQWASKFAPTVIAFDTNTGLLITRFIKLPLLAEQNVTVVELVAFLKNFHTTLSSDGHYPVSNLNTQILFWLENSQPNPELGLLFDDLPPIQTTLEVCHNDLNPWNILIDKQSPDQWRVLDWEMAGLNSPLFDLVCLHEGVADRISLDALVDGYYQDNKPNETDIHNTVLLFWFREYAWAINQIQRGNDIMAIRDQAAEFEGRLLSASHSNT